MLIQSSTLEQMPIGSIRSAARIGAVESLIVNPHNLHVDAFECKVASSRDPLLLLPLDILELNQKGIIINDHDNLLEPEDAIRLKPILEIGFHLVGLSAYVGRKKVGNVDAYAVHAESLFVQKIYVKPSFMRRFHSSQLVFDRGMVKEITRSAIYFHDTSKVLQNEPALKKQSAPAIPQASASTSFTKLYE